MKIFIEDTAGNRYEAEVDVDMHVSTIAADFFDAMEWSQQSADGRGQRAVVELVQAAKSLFGGRRGQRLRHDMTIQQASIEEGSVLRVYPEAIAGMVDPRLRNPALVADLRDMKALSQEDDRMSFVTERSHPPTEYTLTLNYRSFVESPNQDVGEKPKTSIKHQVKITLGAEYPIKAPTVRWLTPIYHPNIDSKDLTVCMGQLMENYVPSLGLARIVTLLIEIVQWRNFDIFNALNVDAANWAFKPANWVFIEEIGGTPQQIEEHLINPINWGNTTVKSPFQGEPQPLEYKLRWEAHQLRKRVEFVALA